MKIVLTIERLVVDGVPLTAAQGRRLRRAIELELSRLFTAGGVSRELANGGATPRIDGAHMRLHHNERPDALGRRIARSIYAGIGRQK